jgi:hypothetical protein
MRAVREQDDLLAWLRQALKGEDSIWVESISTPSLFPSAATSAP